MFCPKCGQWNAGSAAQCTACGTSLLPPGLGNAPSPMPSAPTVPAVPPQPNMPQPPAYNSGPVPYNSGPPAYPTAMPAQTAYPSYPQQNAPSSQPAQSPYPNYPHQSSQQPYPAYPQQSPPAYPQQQPYPNASAPAPGSAPPAYPSYSPMPSYSPLPGGTPYGAVLPYGAGYPAQMQRAPLSQCRVCGSMIATGVLSCPICLVPLGMIANPYDPTVTTYLDARALLQPGTSPVYAAPGAYAGRAANPLNDVPNEAKQGWNWAAALNSTLWAFVHRTPGWGLVCGAGLFFWLILILAMSSMSGTDLHGSKSSGSDTENVIVGLIFVGGSGLFWLIKTLYLGSKGNAIAWRSGRYTNVTQMRNVQRQWTAWSIVVFLVASAVLFTATYIAGSH